MAEILGAFASAITIVGLFRSCIDAFELVQVARHQGTDYNRLLVKLNIEKCRLYTWGQMMDLTSTSQDVEPRCLATFQFRDLVKQTLQTLYDLFHDTQKIKDRYGCRETTFQAIQDSEEANLINPITTAFRNFHITREDGSGLKFNKKTRWAIRDRDKFTELISQIRELVDGLQEITKSLSPVLVQDSAVTARINTITDVDTLQLISEVSEEDHPAFSQIASRRSELLSMSDARRAEVEAWISDETPLLDSQTNEVTDIENMGISELKRYVLSLLSERQQRENHSRELNPGFSEAIGYGPLVEQQQLENHSRELNPEFTEAIGYVPLVERQQWENDSRRLTEDIDYLNLVEFEFRHKPGVCIRFSDILKDWDSQVIDRSDVEHRVSELFAGHARLIQGLQSFLHPGRTILYRTSAREVEAGTSLLESGAPAS